MTDPFNPVAWLMDRIVPDRSQEPQEQKAVIGLDDALAGWAGLEASRMDGTNFRTNQVTLAEYQDRGAAHETSVLGLSAAWACTNLLAGTIASLPISIYQTINKVKQEATDHYLYRLLHDSPNADQTAYEFFEFIAACLELRGNGFSEISRRNDGTVFNLAPPLPPQLVMVERASNGALQYHVTENGRRRTVPQSKMLHLRGFGGSPLGGLSTLAFGRSTFGTALQIEAAARSTFRNGLRTNGAFVSAHPLDQGQMDTAEARITEKYTGAMNAGRPLLLNHGMDWKSISINPEDAQMLESRSFSVEEICRFFGVPPFMIGHTEKSTSWGTGLEQQTLGFQKFTLRKRLKRIEMALEKQLLRPVDVVQGISIEFNVEALLRGDSQARSKFYQTMAQIGAMTINEIRALEGLPPIPGGDVPRIQTQNAPIAPDKEPAEDEDAA